MQSASDSNQNATKAVAGQSARVLDFSPNSADNIEFEELLKKGFDATRPGELITGSVLQIGRDYVVVDIGFKSEGHIPKNQDTQPHRGDLARSML